MISSRTKQGILWFVGVLLCLVTDYVFAQGTAATTAATGATASGGGGIGTVASQVTGNLGNIAKLITAGSYVAGFGFAVAAIVKFKAHKDAPTQTHLSQPIVLLFVAAALIFIPGVMKTTGATLFSGSSGVSKISGVTSF